MTLEGLRVDGDRHGVGGIVELRVGAGAVRLFPAGDGWTGWAFRNGKKVSFLRGYATNAEAVEAGRRWLRVEQRARVYIGWSWAALLVGFLASGAIFQGRLPWWGPVLLIAAWLAAPAVARAVARGRADA